MDEIKIFTNNEFGDIRTIILETEPWFVGKDVATALGYSNTRDALANHVDSEDKNTVAIHDGIGNPNKTIINESGVYALIFGSQLPSAKIFKRWITSDVLPTIRKYGGYLTSEFRTQVNDNPKLIRELTARCEATDRQFQRVNKKLIKLKNDYKNCQTAYESLWKDYCVLSEENDHLNLYIQEQEEAQRSEQSFVNKYNELSLGDWIKLQHIKNFGRTKFFKFLREQKILTEGTTPYQKYINQGYFSVREVTKKTPYGDKIYAKTYVTSEGQQFLSRLLKRNGIY